MKIGFVTCQEHLLRPYFPTQAEPDFISPEGLFTPDDYIAAQELRAHGHEVLPIVWGRSPDTLRELDIIIVRSPWDYAHHEKNKTNFFAWLNKLQDAGLPVVNPPALMHWMLDKHYLQDLAKHDVSTIPTEYLDAGSSVDLTSIFKQRGSYVLKQCVSAGGSGLFFIDSIQSAEQAQPKFNHLLQTSDYMLQPFIPEIRTHGEWSLIFFAGKYSHSILKKTAQHSILIHADHGGSLHFPVTPPANVIAFAEHVYQQIIPAFNHSTNNQDKNSDLLYMRIDIIETQHGPLLIECEGVEPELFFRAQRGSEITFRRAVENFISLS